MSLIAILGRQPELGLAELESLLGYEPITPLPKSAALIEATPADIPFARLGGVIKLGTVLSIIKSTNWFEIEKYLIKACTEHSQYVNGKLTIGLSAYDLHVTPKILERTGLSIKKAVRATGRSVRLVPNKTVEISTAQILHNKLTHENGWELILYRNGKETILARTNFVQDIEAYTERDQARPKRDARVGMLPPKLAQIIVNLATGSSDKGVLLDPFCGTGVILQEASLMGIKVYGTDLEPRMIEYSSDNLKWLSEKMGSDIIPKLEVGDATKHKWQKPINFVACETFLGRPFGQSTTISEAEKEMHSIKRLLTTFLKNLSHQLEPGTGCCFAIPAWFVYGKLITTQIIDQLTDMGYTLSSFRYVETENLVYRRSDQVVGRQLITCIKK